MGRTLPVIFALLLASCTDGRFDGQDTTVYEPAIEIIRELSRYPEIENETFFDKRGKERLVKLKDDIGGAYTILDVSNEMNSCGVLLQFEATKKYFWVYVDRKNRKMTAIHPMSFSEVERRLAMKGQKP